MRVVQINAVYASSSTGRTTKEMHEELIKMGVESYVFCSNFSAPSNNVFQIGNKLDHLIHALFSRLFGLQGYFSCIPSHILINRLKRIKPDVVVLRNLHANYVHVEKLLSYLGKNDVKTIVVLHDCWFYTGHCCYYFVDKCNNWKTECNNCPILYKYNKSIFFDNSRKIFRDKKRAFSTIKRLIVVGVSKWVTNEAKQSPIFQNAQITHVYNWIDLDIFKPVQTVELRNSLGLFQNDFVAISVSSVWKEEKGLYKILSVAKRLPHIKFVLVGSINGVDLPKNVISVGPVSSMTELAGYYSMADVYLNFSIQETFGKVSAEAISCGTPVIAHNSTANPELIGPGCGLVINTNDENSIIEAVDKLYKMDRDFCCQTCRDFAIHNFNKEKAIQQYLEMMKEELKHDC